MAALQADVAALKQDLTSLVTHLKTGATNGAQQAAGQIDEQAQLAYRKISDQGERSIKAISKQIEDQPLMSLLVMLGIGFIGGRLLAR
jgi:ElaB/YqjD/DUF883 family membrane-anchored ribosome-binding protein